jgi:hypothetical protein
MSFLDITPNNKSADSDIVSNAAVVLALLHINTAQLNLAAQRQNILTPTVPVTIMTAT